MEVIEHPLDFERPLVELEAELFRLREAITAGEDGKQSEFARLERRVAKMREELYSKLTPYQRVQLSRHFDRPLTSDYAGLMIDDFIELHGDRRFRDDPAIIGGLGALGRFRIVLIGQQRGKTTEERIHRNFGMPQPDGYRKALRLFELAERFRLPVVTLIDTSGAYPGIEAEERGQAEAIARNLLVMAGLEVPIISVVIGEGGSGGALALGVANRILMLENACYSVISPEGCASILWRGQEHAATAAEALKVTASDLLGLGIADEVVPEPVGGAHRAYKEMADALQSALLRHLEELSGLSAEQLIDQRYSKFRAMGVIAGSEN